MRRDFRRHIGAIYHRSQAHVYVCACEYMCVCVRLYVCVWVYATTKPVHRRQTTATGLGLATDTGERADYLILFPFFGVKNFYLASVESCRRVSWRRRRNDISVLAHTHPHTLLPLLRSNSCIKLSFLFKCLSASPVLRLSLKNVWLLELCSLARL